MFPLSDFNVVCCALATVSAAVGYQYTKRRTSRTNGQRFGFGRKNRSFSTSSSSSETTLVGDESEPSKPDENAYTVTEPGSLKRKFREAELNNLVSDDAECDVEERSGTPRKKLRFGTPNSEEDGDYIFVKVEEPSPEPPEPPMSPIEDSPSPKIPLPDDSQDPVHEPVAECKPESSVVEVEEKTPEAAPKSPVLPSAFTVPSYKPCTGFSAFASSSASPFSNAFASDQQPAWRKGPAIAFNPLEPQTLIPIMDTSVSSLIQEDQTTDEVDNALAALSYSKTTQTNLTGEEEEDVAAEVKGVKLFVKRGDKDFTDGIFGNLKLLSHKESKEERLVLRREPVWKVSMSVRLHPTVRCTFDEDQGVLRIVHIETLDEEVSRQQVVVYALKRGKLPKTEFVTFAQQVIKSSHLCQAPSNAT